MSTLRIEESYDDVKVYLNDKFIGRWHNEGTHEELFTMLADALGINSIYEEIY